MTFDHCCRARPALGARLWALLLAVTLLTSSPVWASPSEDPSDEMSIAFAELILGSSAAVAAVVLWCGATYSIARGHRDGTRWHTYNYVLAGIHSGFATMDFVAAATLGEDSSPVFIAFGVAHALVALVSLGAGLWAGSLPAKGPPRVSWSPTSLTVRF